MLNTIVVDLDGTLANIDHRAHLVRQDKPQWDEFYDACDKDTPNAWCRLLMAAFIVQGIRVVIVSARRDDQKEKTEKWLVDWDIPFHRLILLRRGNDSTPDTELKKAWLDSYGRENILFVVDDRQKVVDMWRREGLVCLQAYAWPEYKRVNK